MRRLRESQNLKVAELAAAVGVAWAQINRWEEGVSRPRQENLERLARVLGVEPGDFFADRETADAFTRGYRYAIQRMRLELGRLEAEEPMPSLRVAEREEPYGE